MLEIISNISPKVLDLYKEVNDLKLNEPIKIKIAEDSGDFIGRVTYEEGTLKPTLHLLKSSFENKSPELEHIVAHELMHIWRKRKLFSRVRYLPLLKQNDAAMAAAYDIEKQDI